MSSQEHSASTPADRVGDAIPDDDESTEWVSFDIQMTLRDYFAVQVVAAIVIRGKCCWCEESTRADACKAAYRFADAMMVERAKGDGTPDT